MSPSRLPSSSVTDIASVYAAEIHSSVANEPPRSRRIAGAAVCAIVESSRSITIAASTTANPSQAARAPIRWTAGAGCSEVLRASVDMTGMLSSNTVDFGPQLNVSQTT
ncbi:MAG TPA: hypothetical protein VFW09_09855 [Solirubrobacteraceae bacterium]|nr:hypothetical protein [Solirubrobacteraceae bacterium]